MRLDRKRRPAHVEKQSGHALARLVFAGPSRRGARHDDDFNHRNRTEGVFSGSPTLLKKMSDKNTGICYMIVTSHKKGIQMYRAKVEPKKVTKAVIALLASVIGLQCGLACDAMARGGSARSGSGHVSGRTHSTRATTVRAKADKSRTPVYKLPDSRTWKQTAAPTAEVHNTAQRQARIVKSGIETRGATALVQRDANGKIARSASAKRDFMRMTGYPKGRPGYVVDHVIPLKRGGPDTPANMQWQTVEEAKAKDKRE